LDYRVGRYGTFLDSMLSELSDARLPTRDGLRTRAADDASIALLDAGASLLDVLTFYQERIANEGYLRTATERRSVLELAKLVGYKLRPGVSASAYLAFTIEQGHRLTIQKGCKAQSIPGPDELPQTFETSEDLEARWEWNQLVPRRTEPQLDLTKDLSTTLGGARLVYLKGTSTGLRVNDPLLVQMHDQAIPKLYRVVSVTPDTAAERTLVRMRPWDMGDPMAALKSVLKRHIETTPNSIASLATAVPVMDMLKALNQKLDQAPPNEIFKTLNEEIRPKVKDVLDTTSTSAVHLRPWLTQLLRELDGVSAMGAAIEPDTPLTTESTGFDIGTAVQAGAKLPGVNPRGAASLTRSLAAGVSKRSDAALGVIGALEPKVRDTLPNMLRNARMSASASSPMRVYALRVRAPLFGHNAPRKVVALEPNKPPVFEEWSGSDMREPEKQTSTVHLDAKYEAIAPGSWVVVDTSAVDPDLTVTDPRPTRRPLLIARAGAVHALQSRSAYGLTGPTTSVPLTSVVDPPER
jgi:hypothetical protein